MRIVCFICSIFFGGTVIAQKDGKIEIARDPMFIIRFDSTSYFITPDGIKELDRLDSLFKDEFNFHDYEIFLSGVSTINEIALDKFTGLKRCKIVVDMLIEKYGFPRDIFKIEDEIPRDNKKYLGVHYSVIDKCKSAPLTPEQEEEYFHPAGNKKLKK